MSVRGGIPLPWLGAGLLCHLVVIPQRRCNQRPVRQERARRIEGVPGPDVIAAESRLTEDCALYEPN